MKSLITFAVPLIEALQGISISFKAVWAMIYMFYVFGGVAVNAQCKVWQCQINS